MKTKLNLTIVLVFLILTGTSQIIMRFKNYILFGDHSGNKATNEIFFDRRGDLYPDATIDNEELRGNYAALTPYFDNEPDFRKAMREQYNKYAKHFESIQDSIAAVKGRQINKVVEDQKYESITFIMVGYNNDYADAKKSLDLLKSRIKKKTPKSFVIQLFWDGTNLMPPLDNFRYATATSYFVGLGLRQLIENIACKNIILISHSLGANLICETLFNQKDKVTNFTGVREYLQSEYDRKKYKTPASDKHITLALIAPAMPGTNTFSDFMERTYPVNSSKKDNYRTIIGFNTNDQVLKKYVGVRQKLGSTTLGSSKQEVEAVVEMFKKDYPKSEIDILDFSSAGPEHSIRSYMNCLEYEELLDLLYK